MFWNRGASAEKDGADDDLFSATTYAWNGVAGAAKGGPFPFDNAPPKSGTFDGTVSLEAASVTGIVFGAAQSGP